MASTEGQGGFYCSTSGTYFSDKESLSEHYKSDFHRYNLKRKVAGLPPVTREWFEARKAQLSSASAAAHQRIWYDPLTKKKFQTANTYQAHVNSKKYQELVRQSGQPAPAPIIMIKQLEEATPDIAGATAANGAAAAAAKPGAAGFTVKPPHRSSSSAPAADGRQQEEQEDEQSDASSDTDESGWETASEDEEAAVPAAGAAGRGRRALVAKRRPAAAAAADGDGAASGSGDDDEELPAEEDWEEWDVCVSLFDNKRSGSMQENLEYMYKHFGFYLPDAQALTDPAGLLKYLGAKLQYGKVPLYSAGDDTPARQFRSLHAVQRHMVDTNQCKLLYDNNEDEYADFYDYAAATATDEDESTAESAGPAEPAGAAESAGQQQLALATSGIGGLRLGGSSAAGFELTVQGSAASGGGSGSGSGGGSSSAKALGSRELARYYRQRPRPVDARQSVVVNSIVARYRLLGVETAQQQRQVDGGLKRAQKEKQRQQRQWLNLAMHENINHNLPKNVTY